DARFDPALALLGGMVLGIFRKIAVLACLRDGTDHRRPFHRLEVLQLGLKALVAGLGHGDLLHCSLLLTAKNRPAEGPPQGSLPAAPRWRGRRPWRRQQW